MKFNIDVIYVVCVILVIHQGIVIDVILDIRGITNTRCYY